MRFQDLFHSPPGVLFRLSLTVLVHYRVDYEYLALEDGPPHIQTGFHVSPPYSIRA